MKFTFPAIPLIKLKKMSLLRNENQNTKYYNNNDIIIIMHYTIPFLYVMIIFSQDLKI